MTDQCKHCTYKGDIKACKAAECFQHENWYAKQLQTENEALKSELSNVVAGLFSEVEINKIKANAIREAAIMPKWGGQPDDIPSDFDGYCQAIHGMHEYANNLTKS